MGDVCTARDLSYVHCLLGVFTHNSPASLFLPADEEQFRNTCRLLEGGERRLSLLPQRPRVVAAGEPGDEKSTCIVLSVDANSETAIANPLAVGFCHLT